MRALLLATAGVFAFGGAAMANGNEYPRDHRNRSVVDHYAAALGVNLGLVEANRSTTRSGQANSVTMRGSFNSAARGVFNVNQNAGANSAQQNAVAVAYVEGCDCEVRLSPRSRGDGDANAVAANAGGVIGNTSENGGRGRGGYDSRDGGGSGTRATAMMDGSFVGATGIAQVNQNAGANSLQQNATAVAYTDNLRGRAQQDRDAYAIAVNAGIVSGSGNRSADRNHTASGEIVNSFGGFTGVANVNQNVGANSLQQNSAALSAVEFCDCAARDLSTTVAAAGNIGGVVGNYASARGGSASVTMGGSFNGMTGIAQVSQNAGANSLTQNAVAVGAVYNR